MLPRMTVRLSVNVNDETAALFKREAAAQETTVTEIVRRAASVYAWAVEAGRNGERIYTETESGTVRRIELV